MKTFRENSNSVVNCNTVFLTDYICFHVFFLVSFVFFFWMINAPHRFVGLRIELRHSRMKCCVS